MNMMILLFVILNDLSLFKINVLINGEWVGGVSCFDVIDLVISKKLVDVVNLGVIEMCVVLVVVEKVWLVWCNKIVKECSVILMKWFYLMYQYVDDLVCIMIVE